MFRRTALKVLGAGTAGVAGLTSSNGVAADNHVAQVQAVHAVPDAPGVDLYADSELVAEEVAFGDVASLTLPPGTTTLDVSPAGAGQNAAVTSRELTVEGGESYTVVALGELSEGSIRIRRFVDETRVGGPLANSTARTRVVHAVPDLQEADLTVTVFNDNPDQDFIDVPEGVRNDLLRLIDLFQATGTAQIPRFIRNRVRTPGLLQMLSEVPEILLRLTLFDDVGFGSGSDYLQVPSGDYRFTIREALDDETPVDPPLTDLPVSFESNTVYTVVALGYADPDAQPVDEPLDAVVLVSS
jgi:hypothetical protein